MNARRITGAAVLAITVIGMPTAAMATADYVGTTPPEVEGIEFTREPVAVRGVQESRDPGATLPVTGGDIAGLALLGAGAVALGTVLVRRGRTASVTA